MSATESPVTIVCAHRKGREASNCLVEGESLRKKKGPVVWSQCKAESQDVHGDLLECSPMERTQEDHRVWQPPEVFSGGADLTG